MRRDTSGWVQATRLPFAGAPRREERGRGRSPERGPRARGEEGGHISSHRTAWVAALLGVAALVAPGTAAAKRERLDVRLFTRVGLPGQPEPVAIGLDRRVYVGTNQQGFGPGAGHRSRVFVYDRAGRLVRQEIVGGQPLGERHGVQGLAFDGSGLLYVLDRSADPRVIRLDPSTGRQTTYATFADVPPCRPGSTAECSATEGDARAGPDYAAFAPDGALYVTDIDQGLIWKVARGGGRARVWYTHPRLDSAFGPNGIQFRRDGRTLLFAVTLSGASEDGGDGLLLELPVGEDGRPGTPRDFWRGALPDGFAISQAGNVYLAQASNRFVMIDPAGREVASVPATPAENRLAPVPFDGPASVAFLDRRLLVSNQSYGAGNPDSWVVYDIWAGERGLPLFAPVIAPRRERPGLRLSVTPRAAPRGSSALLVFRARVGKGKRERRVAGARISFAGRTLRTNEGGIARLRFRLAPHCDCLATVAARGLRSASVRYGATRIE